MFRIVRKYKPVQCLGGGGLKECDLCPRLSCSKTAGDCHVFPRDLVGYTYHNSVQSLGTRMTEPKKEGVVGAVDLKKNIICII